MKSGIYKIINPKGEVYIGKTCNFKNRLRTYKLYKLMNNQPKLHASFDLYGFENHTIELINEDQSKEKEFIAKYDSYYNGLNGNKGGGGPETHSEESRKKISIAGLKNKGKRVTSHRKGKKLNKTHRENISKANKGVPKTGNNKPILQYDKKGNFITEHPSIEAAAILVKGNPTAINNALRKGGNATSASYIWRYKD
jgi:group I intron endonuclease